MSATLSIRNRCPQKPVNLRLLRRVVGVLLVDLLHTPEFELGIRLVGAGEMTVANEHFLRHAGSTDVITFDHRDSGETALQGDIFICLDEAVIQAKRFGTTWQNELVRYVVHGILHLLGYDDQTLAARRKMKAMEVRLLKQLTARFSLAMLGRGQGRGRAAGLRRAK